MVSYRLTGRLGGTMATIETQDYPRIDSLDKVTGRAEYTEDTADPPGTVCGRVLLSPYSHARIRSIDASKAEQLPGVRTKEHLPGVRTDVLVSFNRLV